MSKTLSRILSALLAAMIVASMAACLAETETETYTDYFSEDSAVHTVIEETWEYPIVDGERGSGKPVDSKEYTESHTFEDGKCIYCGAEKSSDNDSAAGSAASSAEEAAVTTASGAELTVGMPALETLKAVFAALPEGTEVTVEGVDSDIAEQLIALIRGEGTQEELMALLAGFPVQTVDGVECYVITLSWGDITENFAFSTADGSLVKVF